MTIYEPKKELCKICNKKDAVVLPLCNIDEEIKLFPVCMECRDDIPYEIIPVTTELDQGYFYCEYYDVLEKMPTITEENIDYKKSILAKYGKKLLEGKNE